MCRGGRMCFDGESVLVGRRKSCDGKRRGYVLMGRECIVVGEHRCVLVGKKKSCMGKNILMGKENVRSGEGGEFFKGEEECFEMGKGSVWVGE